MVPEAKTRAGSKSCVYMRVLCAADINETNKWGKMVANNGSRVEEIWNNFKKIVSECI
jgi:hypothetical protein